MVIKPLQQSQLNASLTDLPPLGMDVFDLVEDFRCYYTYTLGRDRHSRSAHYAYQALVLILRDRLMERWKSTRYAYEGADCKQAYYLSLEFLIGRTLGNATLNLGLDETSVLALQCLGLELEELAEVENDAGLATVAWGGWPPVFSTAAPRCSCLLPAMAFATSTACFAS